MINCIGGDVPTVMRADDDDRANDGIGSFDVHQG